jgi:hypothetical protein
MTSADNKWECVVETNNKNTFDSCPNCKADEFTIERKPFGSGYKFLIKSFECKKCHLRLFSRVYYGSRSESTHRKLICDECQKDVNELYYRKSYGLCKVCVKSWKDEVKK